MWAFCLHLEPLYLVCLQIPVTPLTCESLNFILLFYFYFFHVYLVNVPFCCTLGKYLKSKLYVSHFSYPISLFLQLLFISFSLADGQLARKTAGHQVKKPFAFALSSLLFHSVCVNRDKCCLDPLLSPEGQS